jgi:hypothetical protein
MKELATTESTRVGHRPRVLTVLGWLLVISGGGALIVVGRSMLTVPQDEITEFRGGSPIFFSLLLICPFYVVACGVLILRGMPFSKWMVFLWFGYWGPGSFSTLPIFGAPLAIPFFGFAAYALFNPASERFFRRGQVGETDGKAKARQSLAALATGGILVGAFVLSAPFGSLYFSPTPPPPVETTNVYFVDYVAWQSELYCYRFDASSTTCSNFAISLLKRQSFQKQPVELRVETFTHVPINDQHLPRWFNVLSVKNGTLLTEKARVPSSYAVIDNDRKRLYYYHCQ